MNGKREELLFGEVRVAERLHSLDVIRAGGEAELAAAFAVVEAAVKIHSSGIAAQLEVDGGVFPKGEARIEAVEVADFVGVAPRLVMAPGGALQFEIHARGLP